MISLIFAIICSALVSLFMKLSSKYVQNEMIMFASNYFICFILAIITNQNATVFEFHSITIILGIISGILYLASFMLMKFNMNINGVVYTSIFMKLGVLIPTLSAIFIFKEQIQCLKILGIALSLIAILIFYYEKDHHFQGNKIYLLLLLIGGGLGDAMAQFFDQFGKLSLESLYLFMTFFIAFLCACAYALIKKERFNVKDFMIGTCIAIPNFGSSKFLLQALTKLDAVFVYPMYSVTTLVVIALFGVILFKEKLNKWKILAIFLVIVAIWLLNC